MMERLLDKFALGGLLWISLVMAFFSVALSIFSLVISVFYA